jgi:DNA-binding beta-propeller fold protein YncE
MSHRTRSRRRCVLGACIALLAVCMPAAQATAPAVVTGRHLLFAPSFSSNVVTVWDGDTYKRIATIPIEKSAPCCAHATPDGKRVFVIQSMAPEVTTIDVATMHVLRYTHLPNSTWADRGSEIQNDGKMFWASNIPEGNIFGIDVATGQIKHSYPGMGNTYANSRDGTYLYVTTGGRLEVRLAATGQLISSVGEIAGVRVNVALDDKTLYLQSGAFPSPGDKTEVIEVINIRDPRHPRKIKTMPVPGTSWPGALSPDGRYLWLAGNDKGFVRVFDLKKLTIAADITTGHAGGGVVISKNGKAYVMVSPQPIAPVQGPSGWLAYFGGTAGALLPISSATYRPVVDQPGEIYVYDARTFKRVRHPRMVLPGISFVLEMVDNPPPGR